IRQIDLKADRFVVKRNLQRLRCVITGAPLRSGSAEHVGRSTIRRPERREGHRRSTTWFAASLELSRRHRIVDWIWGRGIWQMSEPTRAGIRDNSDLEARAPRLIGRPLGVTDEAPVVIYQPNHVPATLSVLRYKADHPTAERVAVVHHRSFYYWSRRE